MKISLISLNLNGAAFLENFLESVHVEISGLANTDLILLDNGSTDNSIDLVLNRFPWVRLMQSPRNLGFCKGCHEAVYGTDSDFLVFLNNDMVLEPGFVEGIIQPLIADESIGISAGLVLNESGTQVDYAGGDMNMFGWGFQRHHKTQLDEFEEILSSHDNNRQFFACGGALAISRDLWIKSGGFDPDYFAFFEDVDFGWRLNVMGYRTQLATKARVQHKHHGTAASMSQAMRTYLLERNSLMSVVKNYDDKNLGKFLPWAISMLNERSLIDSGITAGDVFKGRWASDVFEDSLPRGTVDLKDQGKERLKKARDIFSGEYSGKKQPVRNLAFSEVFQNWDRLMKKRETVQSSRKVPDSEIISQMGEPFRSVLGHKREKNLMEIFEEYAKDF